MNDTFRFSPRPNRAADIQWRPWGAAALEEAERADRPVLLNLTAVWCHWCHLMDETTYSDPAVIDLINSHLLPVRVDADRYPHVQDRYIAGGWPTNAFLTPTGEVLWAGTYIDAAQLQEVASGVLTAWRERRAELEQEIGRRRRALESARGRSPASGLVRREHADDVTMVMRDVFDARNGGFGDAPKFPQPETIELMYAQAAEDASWLTMADQTLDGMLSGELWDAAEGGFFRYAMEADWTAPRHEKLLDINAALLDAYALGAALRGRDDWRGIAEGIVDWVRRTLQTGELCAGSQLADPDYFMADAAARATRQPPQVDATIYTTANARWIAALAAAGARLGRDEWVAQAATMLESLLRAMSAPGGGLFHYRAPGGEPQLDFLLLDTLETARAALILAQCTGSGAQLDTALGLARHMERAYWADDGAFWDRCRTDHDVGALRYRDRAFEANATAARLLLDLAQVTGERRWRALAERTLARLGPQAGRYGPAGAVFAQAIAEYFDQPHAVFIAVPDAARRSGSDPAGAMQAAADGLRRAALQLPVPRLRVWTVPAGHAVGPLRFPAEREPVAYLCTARGCSPPITAPARLVDAGAATVWHA